MHAFYINLDRRADRRAEIESELANMEIDAERFRAIEHVFPAIGCTSSHVDVLKLARERGYESVMIFEDDFMFLVSKDEYDAAMSRLPASYDVVMLAFNMVSDSAYDETFTRVSDGQNASGYIVHSRFYDRLIDRLEEGLKLFIESPHLHWIYINDQYWKGLQPCSEWYAFKTRIGVQRPGFSDLAGKFVNYGS
jgi:glycosyl transferase family 25